MTFDLAADDSSVVPIKTYLHGKTPTKYQDSMGLGTFYVKVAVQFEWVLVDIHVATKSNHPDK